MILSQRLPWYGCDTSLNDESLREMVRKLQYEAKTTREIAMRIREEQERDREAFDSKIAEKDREIQELNIKLNTLESSVIYGKLFIYLLLIIHHFSKCKQKISSFLFYIL